MLKPLAVAMVLLLCSGTVRSKDAVPLPEMTILSTMVANFLGIGEWGFSLLLEYDDESILFDTGFKSDTVSRNAKLLRKDLSKVSKVILTHFS